MKLKESFTEIPYNIIQVTDETKIGITGANEKSSISMFILNILENIGRKVGIIDALDQDKVDKYNFDIGIFTNLTEKHLAKHKTIDIYKKNKIKLFKMCRLCIINADDPILHDIKKSANCDIVTYGIDSHADFTAKDIQYSSSGVTFNLDFCGTHRNIKLNTFDKFNVYNILAAIATCYILGFPLAVIIDGLVNIKIKL
ncbi:Mur ligase family protein [Clostridium ganghwense]|uniref:Mur ligase family protein n=1 Tax=Clostridium ganghwense TaxID=312089 RepID=A0ABT4CT00_9CLOT|nr:Mur ligase family protein [Clostridium ganghwense]MCY6371321.1 Mur ligase family protein [Clostridium ganghwense]